MNYKKHINRPIHYYIDDSFYFITGSIYEGRKLLKCDDIKSKLLDYIQQCLVKFNWKLDNWVILDNHYHLLCKSHKGKDLSKIIQNIHSRSGFLIHQRTQCEKPVWYNYWDYCPRNEKEYLIRLNYLLTNPVKHGYVTDLKDYTFSSFQTYLKRIGREALVKQFVEYPEYNQLQVDEDNY